MQKLQIAFDTVSLDECIEIGEKTKEYIDIIEFGTPLVYEYGVEGIKVLKKHFPDKTILADFKIMDAGALETRSALNAGADIVTVLALSDDKTISESLKEVKKDGKELLVDLINVKDENLEEKIIFLESIGVDYICVHTGSDAQSKGANPLQRLIDVKKIVKNTKVSIAGGVNLNSISVISEQNPDVIIVGGGLVNQPNQEEIARLLKEQMR